MADKKITELTELAAAPAAGDVVAIVDLDAGPATTKKITSTNLVNNNADVSANTTHRSSDGKDHSDVVLNNTHRGIVTGNPHAVTKTEVGLGNVTDDAQLKRAAADFASFTDKPTPVGADLLLIEDSAAANAKKKISINNLPSGAENAAVQARESGTQAITTTFTDVTFDSTDVENNASIIEHDNTNTDNITLKEAGLYLISYHVNIGTPASTGDHFRIITRVRLNDLGTDILGSQDERISLDDASLNGNLLETSMVNSFLFIASASDFITLQIQKVELSGTSAISTKVNATFSAIRLK